MSLASVPQLAADWVFDGAIEGDKMGYAVSTAGDIDGDGYDDLAVGAPKATDLAEKEGVVYLFRGSAGGLRDGSDWQVGSGQRSAWFGAALAAAGDLNGDGYADLVVGAPDYNNGTAKAGAAMAFYGSSEGLSLAPDWTYVSPVRDASLGHAVAGGGDVNGDGYDDLIVGSRWYGDTLAKEGAVLVFYGSADGPSPAPDRLLLGRQAGATMGFAVAGGGDVNGDGYDDVIVGAPSYNCEEWDQGAVFLYLGGPSGLSDRPHWAAYGARSGSALGTAVTWAGDANDDGYDDMVVGAPGDLGLVDHGTLYVYHGSADGPGQQPDLVILAGQPLSYLGSSLAGAGDLNGDGYDDLLAGANLQDDDQPDEGAALIYFGSPGGLQSLPGWIGWGDKAYAGYGFAVGSAGMANSLKIPCIAVGAPEYKSDGRTPLGRAFVHYGPLEPRPHSYIWLPVVIRQVAP